jgi:hypothetical protein
VRHNPARFSMTDPDFAECRDDEMLWEATSADGLDSSA